MNTCYNIQRTEFFVLHARYASVPAGTEGLNTRSNWVPSQTVLVRTYCFAKYTKKHDLFFISVEIQFCWC
jgi:hypothetical protein